MDKAIQMAIQRQQQAESSHDSTTVVYDHICDRHEHEIAEMEYRHERENEQRLARHQTEIKAISKAYLKSRNKMISLNKVLNTLRD